MTVIWVCKAEANLLLGSHMGVRWKGIGRRTKKALLVISQGTLLARNNMDRAY